MIKKNIYTWHRTIGIITIIPVIFWTCSGIMHPFMAHWFKPVIAHETVEQKPLQKDSIRLSLEDIGHQNKIKAIRSFRIVTFNDKTFYQIKNEVGSLDYYSATNGKILTNGDEQYATFLARYFLNDQSSKISSIEKITEFTSQYRSVNRLLPVWKITFGRDDAMDVYVETELTRLGTFNNNQRKSFLWIFNNFHTWDWLDAITNNALRLTVMILFLATIILSAISGIVIYGFMWKRFKKPSTTDKTGMLRKNHRSIGIAVAFVTLTFACSGTFHAIMKFTPDDRMDYVYQPVISVNQITSSLHSLPVDWERVSNIGVVQYGKHTFYQVVYLRTEDEPLDILYLNTKTNEELKDGNNVFSAKLARKFYIASHTENPALCCELMESQQEASAGEIPELIKASLVTSFTREYGFVNKRLPVVKLAYDTPENLTYYIEPTTGRLAAKITDADRTEGYSFAIFHKFLFMDWAGKNIRDGIMTLSALGVLIVAVLGLLLFIRIKK